MTTHTWGTAGTISGLANNQQGNVISQNLATMVQGGAPPTTVTTGFSSLAGVWWHDTTNNQVKVRDQADTAWILVGTVDETNKLFTAAASGIAAIQGANKNLKLDTRSGNVAVTADELVLETSGNTYGVVRSVSLTVSPGTSGANGLDTGTFTANTWYAVWVIYNGTTIAGLLSTSATAPTMPSGYTYKARVGWVRSNATPVLYPTIQCGRTAQYVVDGSILTALRSMASGSTSSVLAAVATATFIPPTACRIGAVVAGSAGSNCQIGMAPNGQYSPGDYFNPGHAYFATASNSPAAGLSAWMLLESSNIYWWSNVTSAGLRCIGWEDNL